jgi:hypothetical protein
MPTTDLPLTDHPDFSQPEKQQLLQDWETFIVSGFAETSLSQELFNYLVWAWQIGGDEAIPNRIRFWRWFFADQIEPLIELLSHFLATPSSAGQDPVWADRLADPVIGDLNRAMYLTLHQHSLAFYHVWHRYLARVLTRMVAQAVTCYLRVTPEATAEDLITYRQETYEDLLRHRDVFREPITDELRAMFAAATRTATPLRQPALFAVRSTVDEGPQIEVAAMRISRSKLTAAHLLQGRQHPIKPIQWRTHD